MDDQQLDQLRSTVIGAAIEVHKTLGSGFQELIYQRALHIELVELGVPHKREVSLPIYYKGVEVGLRRVDFLIDGFLLLELKAVHLLEPVHLAQAINYVEASDYEHGLLINFGAKIIEIKRLFNKQKR